MQRSNPRESQAPDSCDNESTAFLAERVALLFEALPVALYAVLIIGTILALVQWPAIGTFNASLWYGLVLAVTLTRFGLYYAYRRQPYATHNPQRWLRRFLLSTLSSGLVWGSSAYLLFPADNPAHQLFVVFVIGGMASGAITTLSASFRAMLFFLIPAMAPLIVRLFTVDAPLSMTMGGMVALFLVMISVAAWRSYQMVLTSLTRRCERERAEARVAYQAYHDSLTELPNRRLLVERLEQEIARSRRHGTMAAVLFIDIDRFKTINDSLGHTVGDALLREVARRLEHNIREEDTAARLGGDEFVVIASELGGDETLAARKTQRQAEKLGALLSEPYAIEGHTLHTTPSIGIALFPVDDAGADELIKQADIAMYRSKELGRNMVQFYLPEMQDAARKRLVIENELRNALQRREMELYFQPQLDADRRTVGAEALLRWNHPERGMVSPADFIPIAEETGLILPLGEWVLQNACLQLKAWMAACDGEKRPCPGVAVNVSPRQFRQQDFVQRVQRVIEHTGIDPRYLELELTEGMLIENIEDTANKMKQLSALGVRLAIDDFGTGYSSLLYLSHLQVHRIKIDQSFVRNVDSDPGSTTIVETIILMAHKLGLDVVAEGVETGRELNFLRDHGCHIYQGYYFSKPLPADSFTRSLHKS